MPTVKRACKCSSKFQDKTYGLGIRLHNVTKNGDFRCTVCTNVVRNTSTKKETKK